MVAPILVPVAIRLASQFFPMLATKIAGPRAESIAREVVDAAANAAGLPGSTDVTAISASLNGNPMAREELQYRFEELNLKYVADMQDARRSQEQRGGERATWMLIGVAGGLIAVIFLVAMTPLTEVQLAFVTTVGGALLKMFSDAFAFEYGSSRGSKEKDAQVTEFKQALVRVGEERGAAARQMIESQQRVLSETVERATAGSQAAVQAIAQTAAESAQQSRDFVSQLVRGEV
jgi:hypothetical protein